MGYIVRTGLPRALISTSCHRCTGTVWNEVGGDRDGTVTKGSGPTGSGKW